MKEPRLGGPLSAGELAEAVVLADVSVVLTIVGWLLPFGGAFAAAAVTPFAALAVRRRLRAVVVGALAGAAVAFLIAGPGPATQVIGCAAFGFAVGTGIGRGWKRLATLLFALATVWLPASAAADLFLLVFANLRRLLLVQTAIGWKGTRNWLDHAGLSALGAAGQAAVDSGIRYWYVAVPVSLMSLTVLATLASRAIARPAIERLDESIARPPRRREPVAPGAGDRPGPLPVRLEGVRVRYDGAVVDALCGIDLVVEPGTFVAVVGPNGSGKSTLARVLAGRVPTGGTVERPGPPGPGRPGGTAVVAQRPESQVLGVRVRDDVVFGMAPADAAAVDIAAHLAEVGLSGFDERETATLSGGELQRLAIAAALARRPALLLSDESTTMLDPDGRADVVALLRRLPARGIAVVHITHHDNEVEGADAVVHLDRGRVVSRR